MYATADGPTKFHTTGFTQASCSFGVVLMPVVYFVFKTETLRQLLDRYDIPHIKFTTVSEVTFTAWLCSLTPAYNLPPTLLVLYTMIAAFGQPPAPNSL